MESEEKTYLTDLKKDLSDYVELRTDVWRLHAYEKLARFSSATASVLLLLFLLLFFLLFLFIAIGFYLSTYLGGYAAGFGVVSLFYVVLLGTFLVFRKKIFDQYLTNKIIASLTDDDEEIQ